MRFEIIGPEADQLAPELAYNRAVQCPDPYDVERAARLYPVKEYPRFVETPNGVSRRLRTERVLEVQLVLARDVGEGTRGAALMAIPGRHSRSRYSRRLAYAEVGAEMGLALDSDRGARAELARKMLKMALAKY